MNEAEKKVHEVMEELSQAHYLGNIKSIAVVTINKENEPELRIALTTGNSYSLNTGYDLMKHHLLNKLLTDGAKSIKDDNK